MTARTMFTAAVLLSGASCAWGQPPPAPVGASDPADQPAERAEDEAPPSEAGEAEPPAAEGTPAAADFARLFGEWKDLIAKLRELQTKYATATAAERNAIEDEYAQLVKTGEAMEPKVIEGAETAYLAAPNQDQTIANFVASLVKSDLEHDRFEEALRRARLLVDNDYGNPRVYGMAGVAAFNTSEFDAAEEYLKLADKSSVLDETGQRRLRFIDQYQEMWKREQEIRAAEAQADDLPRVLVKTSKGDIVAELFENEAPNTVANFISLVEKGFYNGVKFHRVLPGFMAQGGAPKEGDESLGYTIPCECYQENHRLHFRGSLSMAHAGKDTGGSQYFLMFGPSGPSAGYNLNGKHTVFGRVIEGIEVLAKIERIDPQKPSKALPDTIIEATVLRKRDHAYEPMTVPSTNK